MIKRIKMQVVVEHEGDLNEYELSVPEGLTESDYQNIADGVAFQNDWSGNDGITVSYAIRAEVEQEPL